MKLIIQLRLLTNNLFLNKHLCKSMSSINKIAICQFTSTNDKEKNFNCIEKFIKHAFEQKAKMVFLPEGTDYIACNDTELKNLSESLDGPLMFKYKNLAQKYQMWLSIGGFHELQVHIERNFFYNSHVIINDEGIIAGIYRKIHLFDLHIEEEEIDLKESNAINPGPEIVPPVKTPIGTIGLMICYDLRFPELSTILRKMGANILTYPSAFTLTTGEAHWLALLKARAIENQCYVIAAAQYGHHNEKRSSFGQSLVIDPWGKIIAECQKYSPDIPTNENILFVTIDKDMSDNIHRKMPIFNHRRDDLYQLTPTKIALSDFLEEYKFSDKLIPGSTVFYSTPYCYAFTNIRCVVPGHVLVASTKAAKRLEDLSTAEANDFFQTVIKVQKAVEKVYGSTSSTICVQDGPEAGRTVAHVHCHILPRKSNDFVNNDEIYAELAKHDKNEDKQIRSLEEMNEEASLLRKNLCQC